MKSNRSDVLDMTLVPVCSLIILIVIVALILESSKKKIPVIHLQAINQWTLETSTFSFPKENLQESEELTDESFDNEFCMMPNQHPLVCDENHGPVCH